MSRAVSDDRAAGRLSSHLWHSATHDEAALAGGAFSRRWKSFRTGAPAGTIAHMHSSKTSVAAAALALACIGQVAADAGLQHEHGTPAGRLGQVHFATSCAPAVQPEFDRGVALLHSFWFSAAIESFNTVLKTDPRCAMAHWGIAMSWWGNPFAGIRSPQALAAGLAATTPPGRAAGVRTGRRRTWPRSISCSGMCPQSISGRGPSRTRKPWSRWPPGTPTMWKRGSSTRSRWIRQPCRQTRPTRIS